MKLCKMIEIYLKYDKMHTIRKISAFICINNHVNLCINSMLLRVKIICGCQIKSISIAPRVALWFVVKRDNIIILERLDGISSFQFPQRSALIISENVISSARIFLIKVYQNL